MEIVLLLIGLAVGFAIGFLLSKSQKPKSEIDTSSFEKEIASLKAEINSLKNEKESLRADFKEEKDRLLKELKEEQAKFLEASTSLEKARTFFKAQEEKITEQNKTNLDVILNPLKERIKDFEEKVDKTYKAESTERITLKAEIKQLVELNKQVSDDANNLTKALKGDNKAQGNWGEVILEKILERSGLSKERKEYDTQVTLTNAHGEIIRPDAIIYLPDNKHIVVDSKVSLVAYQNYVAADTDEQRAQFLKLHTTSIKGHIKDLSDKHYASSEALN